MQKRLKTIATLAAAAFAIVGGAAPIPQEWAVEVSRVRQYQFQATHGDTMELKATFWHDGEPFDLGGEPFRLYWQTNAMESVYWSAPATAASNTVSAVFANTMDPGAPIVYGFLGATSGNYRASFSIRFAPGPGAVPNELPLPAATIDFAKVEVLNPPYYTRAETDLRIVELSPVPDLSPYATKEGLAEAASSGTNYTDSVASTLRDDIASAAKSATNYTDQAIAAADVATPSMVTNIVIDVAPSPGNYAAVSNAAMNAAITNALQDAAIAGKASTADVTLTERFSEWTVIPGELETEPTIAKWTADGWIIKGKDSGSVFTLVPKGDADSTSLSWSSPDEALANITATRALIGYTLGSQSDKPLQPKGDYAPATNITKTALAPDVQASLGKADTALQTAPVTSVNNKTGAVVLSASDVGALGNSGNQNLNGNLSFWNGNLSFEFWDAVLQPVIRVWNTYIEFPPQSGKLALTSDIPSLSGQTFNFATTQGVMDALKTVIETLGGTVINAPSTTISQGE